MARERDLCDVKIKITEYFPDAGYSDLPDNDSGIYITMQTPKGPNSDHPSALTGHSRIRGCRYFTIQRVNGNGANGKSDGIGGAHRHTLEDSDRVKKSSVQRNLLKHAKNNENSPVSVSYLLVIYFLF